MKRLADCARELRWLQQKATTLLILERKISVASRYATNLNEELVLFCLALIVIIEGWQKRSAQLRR